MAGSAFGPYQELSTALNVYVLFASTIVFAPPAAFAVLMAAMNPALSPAGTSIVDAKTTLQNSVNKKRTVRTHPLSLWERADERTRSRDEGIVLAMLI
jgi:hypothetical protein